MIDRDRLVWFSALIVAFQELRESCDRIAEEADYDHPLTDIDPSATAEMLSECRDMLAELRGELTDDNGVDLSLPVTTLNPADEREIPF